MKEVFQYLEREVLFQNNIYSDSGRRRLMSNDDSIRKGFFYGISRIFSFLLTAAIGGILGLSITEETIPTALFAIFGGFIGSFIFNAWWKGMSGSTIAKTFKALIFTLFTIGLLIGMVFIALEKF
jgi:hypothetical protein